jgi:(p)ppGpp synthase/HD superfamily hydrolase
MYTYRVEQAIRAASVLHKDQLRKGSMPFPYITHLVATAFTLFDYTDDEDIIIAALLHDTLEDTDYTVEELEEDFGGRVREIVEAVSEPKSIDGQKLSWRDKKLAYAKQLKKGPKEAVLVAAADKIHNFRTMIEDYYDSHESYMQDFGKNLDERIEVYQLVSNIINSRLDGPILAEYNHVFDEFKQFILSVKETERNKYTI